MERRRVYRRLLAGFFMAMAGFTLLSRIYDSRVVPKVHVVYVQSKKVRTVIEGSGQVKAAEAVFCPVEPDLLIQSVAALRGSQVEAGDVLFCYDGESLRKEREVRRRAWEKAELAIAKEQLDGQGISTGDGEGGWRDGALRAETGPTQGELAAQEAAFAARALEEGQAEYEAARIACEEKKQALKEAYAYKEELTREELLRAVEQELASGQRTLDGAENSREEVIREAQRKVEDLEEELLRLEEGGDERAIQQAIGRLDRAREDVRAVREQWDLQLDGAIAGMDVSEESEAKILAGRTTAQLALKEEYEAALEREDAILEEERKKVEALALALEKAQLAWSNGLREDEAARLDAQQKIRLSELTQKELELDRDVALERLQRIEALILEGGIVRAGTKGTVTVQEMTPGKWTTGDELVEIGVGGLTFQGTFPTEGEEGGQSAILYPGDTVTLHLPGRTGSLEVQVRLVDLIGGEGQGSFLADLKEGVLPIGAVADHSCARESAMYEQVLPIKALRKDAGGYFCLAAREQESVLGRETVAERVDLTPVLWGKEEVAVEGLLFREDPVIVKEKEEILAGDRVRVVTEAEK